MKDWKHFYNQNRYFKFAAVSAAAALLTLFLLALHLVRGGVSGRTLERALTVLVLFSLLAVLNVWRWKREKDGF